MKSTLLIIIAAVSSCLNAGLFFIFTTFKVPDNLSLGISIIMCGITLILWGNALRKMESEQKEQERNVLKPVTYSLDDMEVIANVASIITKKFYSKIVSAYELEHRHEADTYIIEFAMGYFLLYNKNGSIPPPETKERVLHVHKYVLHKLPKNLE